MCLTLLLRTKINILNSFSEQHDRLYNSAAVTSYKLCLHIHESNISDPVMNAKGTKYQGNQHGNEFLILGRYFNGHFYS